MSLSLRPLDGQSMVITGASSGIGLATARLAAARGARVFLVSRNRLALQALCSEIAQTGGEADYAVADVGEPDEMAQVAQAAIARFGHFDTWVNVAGVAIYAALLETPLAEHERLFRTNYWGVVHGANAALGHLRQRGGAFITVGSVVSTIGTPILGSYAASKHAVKGYIDSLRIELLAARAPVSVTLIKPSGIGTPLAEHARNHMAHAAKVPPPAYAPDVVAEAILYAASHPVREVVVGGAGALQTLGGLIAPSLMDRISALIIPLLQDPRRRPPRDSNLDAMSRGNEERSQHEWMLGGSLYTYLSLRSRRWMPIAAAVAALGLGAGFVMTVRDRAAGRQGLRRRRRRRDFSRGNR